MTLMEVEGAVAEKLEFRTTVSLTGCGETLITEVFGKGATLQAAEKTSIRTVLGRARVYSCH